MSNFSRARYNPLELIELHWPGTDVSHITYEPKLKGHFTEVACCFNDGTLAFTIDMIEDVLSELVSGQSGANRFVVGDIKHATVVNGDCTGQWDRIKLAFRHKE